jgi:DNA-binding response OmpR family regulator
MMVAEDMPPNAAGGRPKRVLLVEDEALIRFVTAEHLRGRGFEVLEANDGEEARLMLGAFEVDLVITDFNMPGPTNGLALARWIDEQRPGLPLLLISAVPPAPDRTVLSVAWPAIDKPYALDALDARIAELLAKR